jgi:flagellar hook-length control protein FliK
MEQETPARDGDTGQDFAAIVEAWVPAAEAGATASDGGLLPVTDQSLPMPGELKASVDGVSGLDPATDFAALVATVPALPAAAGAADAAGAARPGSARDGQSSPRDAAALRRQFPVERRDRSDAVTTGAQDSWSVGDQGVDTLAALAAHPTAADTVPELTDDARAWSMAETLSKADTPPVAPAIPGAAGRGDASRLTLDSQLPVLAPQFVERFSEQVSVLVNHGVKSAQLSLNPAELGPIEVRISLVNDEARVHLASAHGVVREVMHDALPRLREMLEASGLRLGDSGVFSELPQQQTQAERGSPPRGIAADWQVPVEEAVLVPRRALSLVDAYA